MSSQLPVAPAEFADPDALRVGGREVRLVQLPEVPDEHEPPANLVALDDPLGGLEFDCQELVPDEHAVDQGLLVRVVRVQDAGAGLAVEDGVGRGGHGVVDGGGQQAVVHDFESQ